MPRKFLMPVMDVPMIPRLFMMTWWSMGMVKPTSNLLPWVLGLQLVLLVSMRDPSCSDAWSYSLLERWCTLERDWLVLSIYLYTQNLTIFRCFVHKGAPSVLQYTPKGTEEAVLLRNISSFTTYDLVYTLVNPCDCLAYRWFWVWVLSLNSNLQRSSLLLILAELNKFYWFVIPLWPHYDGRYDICSWYQWCCNIVKRNIV